jgi:putative transcriptional regulator
MKNRIKVERAELNMTQEQLANLVAVTRQTINAIELKKFVPSTVLALKICKVFNKPVEAVFFLEEID